MKKKYILYAFFLFAIPFSGNAQIKIGNYTFKDGAEYTGEIKARPFLKTVILMKVNM